MGELTAFQRDVLFAVAGLDAPNGQEIRTDLGATQNRDVRSGHVYMNLEELIDAELLEKRDRNGRSNAYSLTDDGESWIGDRLEWENTYASFGGENGTTYSQS